MRERTRTILVASSGAAAALPVPLALGAPVRDAMAYTFVNFYPPRDTSWAWVAAHYWPGGLRSLVRHNLIYLQTHPFTALYLVGGYLALFLVRSNGDRFVRFFRAAAVGSILLDALQPNYTGLPRADVRPDCRSGSRGRARFAPRHPPRDSAPEAESVASRITRRLAFLSIVFVGLAWFSVIQGPGANQNSHLALVTALANHTPRVDRFHNWTGDVAYIDGLLLRQAPGLALVTLPWYFALDVLDLRTRGPSAPAPWPAAQNDMSSTAVWQVGLFGATLPAIPSSARPLGRRRLVPGYGTAGALVVGTGCLFAVLAMMFFTSSPRVLDSPRSLCSSMRGEGRRAAGAGRGGRSPRWIRRRRGVPARDRGDGRPVRRARNTPGSAGRRLCRRARYRGRAASRLQHVGVRLTDNVGVQNAVIQPGTSGHEIVGANASGFFGVGIPSLRAGAELLFAGHGLLVLSPVLALAALGVVSLADGYRAEAAVVGGVAVCFLFDNSAYYLPFGGFAAGPRFLVPAVPFLALGVAAAWRSSPVLTVTMFLASFTVATVSLIGNPQGPSESATEWFNRVENGDFTRTVFDWISASHRTPKVFPSFGPLAAAVAIGLAVTPRFRVDPRAGRDGVVGTRGVANRLYGIDRHAQRRRPDRGGRAGLAGVLGLAAAIPLAFLTARKRAAAALPALLLVPIAWPPFAAHTGIALAAIAIAVSGIVLVRSLPPRVDRRPLGRHSSS